MQLTARLQQKFYEWALRGPAPEPSPVILNQRRVYVLPTRAGIGYAISLAVMLVGSMNYSLSLGYVLTFLLGGLGVSAILNTFRNLAFLRIAPGHSTPVFAGEAAHFGLVLHNARKAERPALRMRAGDKNEGELIDLDLPATDRIEALLPVKTTQRGWMPLPRVMIETRYPLGLIRAWAYVQPGQFCLVYPRPALDAPPLPVGSSDQHDSQSKQRQERGNDDFAGLRDHQASDSPRHVAWKAVARQHNDELLTKLFSGENAQSLWLDWDQLPPGLDVESRLSIMARWVCDANGAGLTWGLRLPGNTLAPGSGEAHRHTCLQALALYG
ncbi:Putative membrane protein [Georgfuchsia toluolica]|uniref:Membrane protein n=1 Tax=Georgfuchsia toluolica TaxID=424218 RepID=A0A916J2I9_9PROT|nr:DUF58 domain-containing protein [Georgfuchsia toluolica]CAG4882957.1 Putative membrane protein [Georgfuchsia toluolica]